MPPALQDDSSDDSKQLDALDGYLARLHAGEKPDREGLLRKFPELASALRCLDALENMSAAAQEELPDGATDQTPQGKLTMPYQDAPAGMADLPLAGEMPRAFGQYELLCEIGRGGMGVVYKARQADLGRTVAIKMILASHLASPEHVRRFQVEARAAARLRHANIVQIHEVGQCHGQHYFTMAYVDGESLAQRLSRGPLPAGEAARVVSAVARAVEHLHQQGIVHRDLKPSNILLDRDGQPYVTDFGLAKVFDPDSGTTATNVVVGTPSYMAPEQAMPSTAEVGPAADVYSLGAILYELLAGQPPFWHANALDTLMDVMGREPTPPRQLNSRVPYGLELIALKCLAKSPGERYASAAALADDLDRFSRGEPLVVRPPHIGQRLLQWTRRQPALASRLGAMGLFYLIEMGNYLAGVIDTSYHEKVSMLLAVWAIASVVCQRFLTAERWALPARTVWGLLDSVLLLAILLWVANGATSSLVIGYPLLIAGSGLWFRVRFVWTMTLLSLVSYAVLVVDFYCWRPELQQGTDISVARHLTFATGLIVLGAIIAYLVRRVQTLSSFCGRRLP